MNIETCCVDTERGNYQHDGWFIDKVGRVYFQIATRPDGRLLLFNFVEYCLENGVLRPQPVYKKIRLMDAVRAADKIDIFTIEHPELVFSVAGL